MNRKTLSMSVIGLPAALIAGVIAIPASAATAVIEFSKIQYNSPGTDNRTNTSLNGEYVRITNNGNTVANLDRWTLRDTAGHVFKFSRQLVYPGRSVYVHTGRGKSGTPDSAHLYWGSGNYIWNNDKDTATLRSASGRTYDTCGWIKPGTGASSCGFMARPVTAQPPIKPTTAMPKITTLPTSPKPTASPTPTTASAGPPSLPPDTDTTDVEPPPVFLP
jgi:hypothetical protein